MAAQYADPAEDVSAQRAVARSERLPLAVLPCAPLSPRGRDRQVDRALRTGAPAQSRRQCGARLARQRVSVVWTSRRRPARIREGARARAGLAVGALRARAHGPRTERAAPRRHVPRRDPQNRSDRDRRTLPSVAGVQRARRHSEGRRAPAPAAEPRHHPDRSAHDRARSAAAEPAVVRDARDPRAGQQGLGWRRRATSVKASSSLRPARRSGSGSPQP